MEVWVSSSHRSQKTPIFTVKSRTGDTLCLKIGQKLRYWHLHETCFWPPSRAIQGRWLIPIWVSYLTLLFPCCHFGHRNKFRQNKNWPLAVALTQPKAVLSCTLKGSLSFISMLLGASWPVGDGNTSAPALWESCSWPEPDQKQEVIEISQKKKIFSPEIFRQRVNFWTLSFPGVTTDFVYASVMEHSLNYGGSPTALHRSWAWVCPNQIYRVFELLPSLIICGFWIYTKKLVHIHLQFSLCLIGLRAGIKKENYLE